MENAKKLLRITTAGSVDDGKSTLIGRLLLETGSVYSDQIAAATKASEKKGFKDLDLSLITDGLAAEREQNITIDVAYRYLTLDGRRIIIADVPGHEQYTRNMVTGASTADLALILVDAKNGLTNQTQRHLSLLSWLAIPEIAIVVNKMDEAGYQQDKFEEIVGQSKEMLDRLKSKSFKPVSPSFIPTSALAGDMVTSRGKNMPWYNGPTVLEYLKSAEAQSYEKLPMRLPVQIVLRGNGSERRYGGRLASGGIEVGQEILCLPSNAPAKITGIYLGEQKLPGAIAGQSIAITLDRQLDISRGDMFADPAAPPSVSNKFTADVVWFPLDASTKNYPYLLKHTTKFSRARHENAEPIPSQAKFRDEKSLAFLSAGASFRLKLVSTSPLIYDKYRDNPTTGSFIFIDEISKNTIAAGFIL